MISLRGLVRAGHKLIQVAEYNYLDVRQPGWVFRMNDRDHTDAQTMINAGRYPAIVRREWRPELPTGATMEQALRGHVEGDGITLLGIPVRPDPNVAPGTLELHFISAEPIGDEED